MKIESVPWINESNFMAIPALVQLLKPSRLSSISFQMDKTFWGVVSAAVEQSRLKASMVAQADGKFGP